jgi:hypothetical protein
MAAAQLSDEVAKEVCATPMFVGETELCWCLRWWGVGASTFLDNARLPW